MDYQIVFSPDLGVNADELASVWNKTPECQKVAKANVVSIPTKSFSEPATFMMVLAGLAGGIAADVIKDLLKEKIKEFIEKKFPKKSPEVEVQSVEQPDGSYLLIVKGR